MKNETYFDSIDSEEKAYWLGFIVADGNLNRNETVMQINLSSKDSLHLEKLGNILGQPVKQTSWQKNGKNLGGCYLAFSSKRCWRSLYDMGLRPAKTHEDQSVVWFNLKADLKRHFIRGLFDGDGCVSFSRSGNKFLCSASICGERRLVELVQDHLSDRLGISKSKNEHRNLLTITRWSGARQVGAIEDYLYKNSSVYLERKRSIFRSIRKQPKKGQFFGVTKTSSGKWNASIRDKNKRLHIGNFETAEEAARAYDEQAIRIGKPVYKLNFGSIA